MNQRALRTYPLLAVAVTLSIAAVSLRAEHFIKVDLEGKSITLDIDSGAVQQNLKPANSRAGAVKLPAWLYPSPGQEPLTSNYDTRTGMATAKFASAGTVDQVVAYYAQLLASKGYNTGAPLGKGTKIVSGKSESATISVMAGVPFRNTAGGSEFTVTYLPSQTASNQKHFEAEWYDAQRSLLCLRDAATNEEYYLDAYGIKAANLNRPGAVKSENAAFPSWFPIYPGAIRPNAKISFMMEPTAVFQTHDSVRAVYDFYRTALAGAGAKIHSQSLVGSHSGKDSPTHYSAEFKAELGDDVVEIAIGEIMDTNPARIFTGDKPLDGVGIGVRYTVPKR